MADLLSIEITGNQSLIEQLNAAVQRIEHPRELLEVLGGTLMENIERRFSSKTDPSGRAWEPLAPSTVRRYAQQDTSKSGPRAGQVVKRGVLLERTGQMISSLNRLVSDNEVLVGMNRLTDGGDWQIPLLHELGTRRMPRRGIFFEDPDAGTLSDEDEADLDADISAFLDDVFGA